MTTPYLYTTLVHNVVGGNILFPSRITQAPSLSVVVVVVVAKMNKSGVN